MSEKFGGRHRRELIGRVRNPSDLVRSVHLCPVGCGQVDRSRCGVRFLGESGSGRVFVGILNVVVPGGEVLGWLTPLSGAAGADAWVSRDARHALQDCCPALCRCPRGLRGLGVVGVAHSRVLCVGGNRGIMRNSNVGSGRGPAPMCNTDDNHTRQARRNLELELDRSRRGVRPISARKWTDLEPEYDRSRRGGGGGDGTSGNGWGGVD